MEKPKPVAAISTPDPLFILCQGGSGVTFYALETEEGNQFQWYHNNSPVGSNSPTHWSGEAGTFHVEVIAPNGCRATSNTIVIHDCESLGGTCENGDCLSGGVIIGNDPIDPPTACAPQGVADFNFNT